jgi:hypothetical protein
MKKIEFEGGRFINKSGMLDGEKYIGVCPYCNSIRIHQILPFTEEFDLCRIVDTIAEPPVNRTYFFHTAYFSYDGIEYWKGDHYFHICNNCKGLFAIASLEKFISKKKDLPNTKILKRFILKIKPPDNFVLFLDK